MQGASSGQGRAGIPAKIPQPDTEGCGYPVSGVLELGGSQDLPQRAKGGFLHPQIPGAKLPAGTALPLPTPSGYTVTYSLNVTVRQFAVTSVIIIFPKKGLNSLRGSSGSSWASAGGFSAAVGAAATAAAVAGTSGFT